MTTTTTPPTLLPGPDPDHPAPLVPLHKCDECGLTTSAPELLREKRRSFRRSTVRLCVRCFAGQVKHQHRINLATYGFYLLLACGVSWVTGSFTPVILMVVFLLYLTSAISLAVLLHELGHGLTARLVGWQVHALILGGGRLLWQGRLGDVLLQYRLVQAGGRTLCGPAPGAGAFRVRAFAVFIAGPLVNLLLMLPALPSFLTYISSKTDFVDSLVGIWFIVNGCLLILNLIPFNMVVNGAPASSDGMLLFRVLFKPSLVRQQFEYAAPLNKIAALRQVGRTKKALAVAREQASRFPNDAMSQTMLSVVLADEKDLPAAEAVAAQALGLVRTDAPLHPAVPMAMAPLYKRMIEAQAKNNLAFFKLKLGGATPEAMSLAEEAWKLMPWESAVQGTYGYALALNGNREEGLAMLKEAAKRNREYPPQTKKELAEMIREFEQGEDQLTAA